MENFTCNQYEDRFTILNNEISKFVDE